MLDRWVDQFRLLGSEAFPNAGSSAEVVNLDRTKELEALVGRLTLENEFLKAAIKKGAELREKKQP